MDKVWLFFKLAMTFVILTLLGSAFSGLLFDYKYLVPIGLIGLSLTVISGLSMVWVDE